MKLKTIASITTLSLFATTLTGCAGIMSGGSDRVTVASSEPGSRIYIDGQYIGIDRIRTDLDRGDDYEIKVTKKGCKTAYQTTDTSLDGWIWANLLIDWGIISIPTDLISGNAFELEKSEYRVTPECAISSTY